MATLPERGTASKEGSDTAHRLSGNVGKRRLRRIADRGTFFARHGLVSGVDHALFSTGIAAAVISASFATYMVSTDHPHPIFGGIEHLMIFAQPSRGLPGTAIARLGVPAGQPGVDYTVTGTIPDDAVLPEALPALKQGHEPIVTTYVLHDAHNGTAIVAGIDGVYRVELGSILPGVGRVLSIERRGSKWVVVTPQGLITDRSP